MDSISPIDRDIARLRRSASALRELVDEIDMGAAAPRELEPVVEFVEDFLLGFLLPVLRDIVGPHLMATGDVKFLPTLHGPGEDDELLEALDRLRHGLSDPAHASELVEGARMLARSLGARADREQVLLAPEFSRTELVDESLLCRLRAAHPDLENKRDIADRLLLALELPDSAA